MTAILEELMKAFGPQDDSLLNNCGSLEEYARKLKEKMEAYNKMKEEKEKEE